MSILCLHYIFLCACTHTLSCTHSHRQLVRMHIYIYIPCKPSLLPFLAYVAHGYPASLSREAYAILPGRATCIYAIIKQVFQQLHACEVIIEKTWWFFLCSSEVSDFTTLVSNPFSVLSPFFPEYTSNFWLWASTYTLMPHFTGTWFEWHILLEGWSSLKLNHHLINRNLAVWLVHLGKPGSKMVNEWSHFPQTIMPWTSSGDKLIIVSEVKVPG